MGLRSKIIITPRKRNPLTVDVSKELKAREIAAAEKKVDEDKRKARDKARRKILLTQGTYASVKTDYTKQEIFQQSQDFLDGIKRIQSVGSSFSLGFLSNFFTLGTFDAAFYRGQKRVALKELDSDITFQGFKITNKASDEQWILKNEKGQEASVNPMQIIKDTFPKNLQQFAIAKGAVTEESSAATFAYNVGSFFGSIKQMRNVAAKVLGFGRARRAARIAGVTALGGLMHSSMEQLANKATDQKVDWNEFHKSNAIWAMFGIADVGIDGIANAYKIHKYIKSGKADAEFLSLTKPERRFLLAAVNEAHKTGKVVGAENYMEMVKPYGKSMVKPKGYKPQAESMARKILREPKPLTRDQWEKIYGKKLGKIFSKMNVVKAETKAAKKASEVMTEQAAAAPGKPKPVPDLLKKPDEITPVIQELTKQKNPYLNMPLEQTKSLAEYGVKGAKDYLAVTGVVKVTPASNSQRNVIVQLAAKYGLGKDTLQQLIRSVSGVSEVEEMLFEEAGELVEMLGNYQYMDAATLASIPKSGENLISRSVPDNELRYLKKIAGSDEAYNKTINYFNQFGGFPENKSLPDLKGLQKIYIDNMRVFAKRQKTLTKRSFKKELHNRQSNLLGTWQNIGYALADFEFKSGIRFREMWEGAVAERTSQALENEEIVWDAVGKAGISRLGRMTNLKTNQQIISWLDEADDEVRAGIWNGMDEKTQKAAEAAEELYQGPAAGRLRLAQFKKWEDAVGHANGMLEKITEKTGKSPSKKQIQLAHKIIKGAKPYNAPDSALRDGKIAFEMGQEVEWAEAQIWGSRARYAPHELDLSSLMGEDPGSSIPQEVFHRQAELGTLPTKAPSAIYARKGEGKLLKSGNVFLDILRHMDRLTSYYSTFDARKNMWEALKHANLSTKDEGNFRKMMDSLLGIQHPTDDWVKIAVKADRFFWQNFLVLDPRGSVKFAWRQMFQNPALAASQFNIKELAKVSLKFPQFTAAKKWVENNPEAKQSYEQYFNKFVSENKAIYRHMVAKSGDISGIELMSKASSLMSILGQVPAVTDRWNRKIIWPVGYAIADSNVNAYVKGDISAGKLWKRLNMSPMHPSYQTQLAELLKDKKYSEFKSKYAEYKTELINMRYNPLLRSTQEMSLTGRLIFGPVTFARGVANIAVKQGLSPILHGTPKQAWGGFKTIIKLLIGGAMVNEVSERTLGYSIYDVPRIIMGIGPLAPGAGSIVQVFDEVNQAIRRAPQDASPVDLAMVAAKVGARNLEGFIGIADVAIDYYRLRNEVKYVHIWDLARKQAMTNWERLNDKPFVKMNLDTQQKIALMFFDVEPKKKESSWQMLENRLNNKRKRVFK